MNEKSRKISPIIVITIRSLNQNHTTHSLVLKQLINNRDVRTARNSSGMWPRTGGKGTHPRGDVGWVGVGRSWRHTVDDPRKWVIGLVDLPVLIEPFVIVFALRKLCHKDYHWGFRDRYLYRWLEHKVGRMSYCLEARILR